MMSITVARRPSRAYKYLFHLSLSSHLGFLHSFSKFPSSSPQPRWESSAHAFMRARLLLLQTMHLHHPPLRLRLHYHRPPHQRAHLRGRCSRCKSTMNPRRGAQWWTCLERRRRPFQIRHKMRTLPAGCLTTSIADFLGRSMITTSSSSTTPKKRGCSRMTAPTLMMHHLLLGSP
jgi:hypothetical protein